MNIKSLLDALVPFPGQTHTETLGIGEESKVYLISNLHVAKPVSGYSSFLKDIQDGKDVSRFVKKLFHECRMLLEAAHKDLPVPKVEGVFLASLHDPSNRYLREPAILPALVMRFLSDTIPVYRIPDPQESASADNRYCQHIERARQMGFVPGGDYLHNALWHPVTKEVHVIDLENWRRT